MPTDKYRTSISLDADLYAKLENYRYSNRFKNQTQAIISLIELGLNTLDASAPIIKPSQMFSTVTQKVAKDYDSLDSHGKRLVQVVVKEEKKRIAAQTEQDGDESAELDLQQEAEDGSSASTGRNAG